MTPAQKALYWREWGACSKALKAHGRATGNEARHALQMRALGYAKSSVTLTNAEFDKVLAIFRAQSRPDDLNAQLRQEDQPEERILNLKKRATEIVDSFIKGNDWIHKRDNRGKYLRSMAQRITGDQKEFSDLNERELQKLVGILERKLRQLDRAAAKRAEELEAHGNQECIEPF